MKRGVYITFDVECSMGGAWGNPAFKPVTPARAIWGRYGDKELGLPLIVEILKSCGIRGTFFVEAFTDEQGYPGEMEAICHWLLDKGQDVQLHVHPNHKHYGLAQQGEPFRKTDQIAELPPDDQRSMLQEAAERLKKWTGQPTIAFRAGNMGASEETLSQLAAVGIPIDSSYTFPYAGGQCPFSPDNPYNGSKWYGKVLELALSGARFPNLPGLHPAQPLDLVGMSFKECRDAVVQIRKADADSVVILHSFSLFKVRDLQYRDGRINNIVTRRFRRFCEWLSANSDDFPAFTFSDLAEAIGRNEYEARAIEPAVLSRPVRALTRRAVQAYNNFYWA